MRKGQCSKGILSSTWSWVCLCVYTCAHVCTRMCMCTCAYVCVRMGVFMHPHMCACVRACGHACVLGVGKAAEHLSSRQSRSCPALDGGLPRRWAGVWGLQPFPEAPPTTAMTRHQLQAGRGPLPGTPRDPGPLQSSLKGKRAGPTIPAAQQQPVCGDPLGATTSV